MCFHVFPCKDLSVIFQEREGTRFYLMGLFISIKRDVVSVNEIANQSPNTSRGQHTVLINRQVSMLYVKLYLLCYLSLRQQPNDKSQQKNIM